MDVHEPFDEEETMQLISRQKFTKEDFEELKEKLVSAAADRVMAKLLKERVVVPQSKSKTDQPHEQSSV